MRKNFSHSQLSRCEIFSPHGWLSTRTAPAGSHRLPSNKGTLGIWWWGRINFATSGVFNKDTSATPSGIRAICESVMCLGRIQKIGHLRIQEAKLNTWSWNFLHIGMSVLRLVKSSDFETQMRLLVSLVLTLCRLFLTAKVRTLNLGLHFHLQNYLLNLPSQNYMIPNPCAWLGFAPKFFDGRFL